MPPPTLFDSDGEPRSEHDTSAKTAHPADAQPVADGPNYLVRRAVVVAAVVAVIAVTAVVVGSLIGGSDDEPISGTASAEWNRIVLLDRATGRVTTTDELGERGTEIDTDVNSVTAAEVVGSTAVLASETATAVVELRSASVTPYEVGTDSITTPTGSTLALIVAAPGARRGLLVHGPSGEAIDTDEFTAVAGAVFEFAESRTDTSGRHILVTDSGNFQSVLFSFDRDEPSFFAGLALAVDAKTVVTTQNVGDEATVSIFDHAGELVASGRTPSVRAGMITGDGIRLVTVDGEIVTMNFDGDTETTGQLDLGTIESGQVMPTGDRLVVTGSTGTAVIDDAGSVVAVAPDSSTVQGSGTVAGSTCISLIRASTSGPDEALVIDARSGSTVAEAQAASDEILSSADGCTVGVALPAGYDIINPDGVDSVGDDVLVALSPDGVATVVERDRRVLLTRLDDTDTDPVDLAPRGRTVFFTEI